MAGDVVFVNKDRLKVLDITGINALKISKKLGLDSKIILKGKDNKESVFKKESFDNLG